MGSGDDWGWWAFDPLRLALEQDQVHAIFPELQWMEDDLGVGWSGEISIWPFERDVPEFPAFLDTGLSLDLRYPQAYPMVVPTVTPHDPIPELIERTQHKWHVNGDGTLCLLQSSSLWTGRETAVPLLMKSAGWRIEYALLKAGLIGEMSLNGIVSDDRFDNLIGMIQP